jgi:hypothetical protein
MVTLQNYEEYIMLYVDEELNATEVSELMKFIKLHPELETELEAYKKTKLPVAIELVYTDKAKLLKQPAKTISLNRWLVYGVAAGIALLIAFAAGKWMNKPATEIIETPEIAKKAEPATAPVNPITPVTPQTKSALQSAPANPVNQSAPIAKVKSNRPATIVKKAIPSVNVPGYRTETVIHPADNDQKQEPEIAKTVTEDDRPTATETVTQPEEIPQPKERKRRGLLALLPISSEKKEGLQHLRNTVEEKVEAVKTINDNIKNTSLELKLGNKELFVINL